MTQLLPPQPHVVYVDRDGSTITVWRDRADLLVIATDLVAIPVSEVPAVLDRISAVVK